jgi:uncharacterized protein (PEP-CTERM system associated)
LSETSSAADWTVSKGATAKLTFTDNSKLSEGGEESKVTTSISPRISFAGKGARASVKFNGSFQIDDRGKGSQSFNPRIQSDGNAELVEDLLFIDADFKASQFAINPFRSSGVESGSDSGNVTTTYSYSVSPYIKKRLKGYADFLARYTYDEVIHAEDNLGDSAAQTVNLSLDSGREFSRVSWGLDGEARKVHAKEGDDSDFKSADANMGYRFNRKWSVNASAGREWNDFTSVQSDDDGKRWDLHAIWTPSPRTTLDIGYGQRFFGSTPSLNFTHRSRRSSIKLGYSRVLTDNRSLIEAQVVRDVFGNIITDPNIIANPAIIANNPFLYTQNFTIINDSVLVNERLDASYTLKGKRSTLGVAADHSKQIYQDIFFNGNQKQMGVKAFYDRTLDGKTSANTDVSWRRSETFLGEEADIISLGVGLRRELGPKTNLSLNYRHTDRDSDTANDSYDENRVTLALDIEL